MKSHAIASRPTVHGLPLKPLAFALACLGLTPSFAQTIPTSPTLRAGSATVGAPTALPGGGLALGISQTSNRAILNWQTFSIGARDQVNIVQPGTSSVLLNRVTGAQASNIAGRLTTTLAGSPGATGGSVFLINPNGVTFANGSSVSVGGLVASTLDIAGPDETTRNAAFMSGGVIDPATARAELSFSGTSRAGVAVESGATITAGSGAGGTVALMGASVRNAGSIQATRGSVSLGSASGITLVVDPVGDGLTTLRITSPATVSALVENTGRIVADGGRVALQAASTAAETVVRQSGVLRAQSIGERAGEIALVGSIGATGNRIVIDGGQIDATGNGAPGGSVAVSGNELRFNAGSIDASGSQGGSVTLFGSRGLGMAAGTSITASGSSTRGGVIGVGADATDITAIGSDGAGGSAQIAGSLTARGATDGGRITTSALNLEIDRGAQIDAAGVAGANGQWRLQSTYDLGVTAAGSTSDPAYNATTFSATNIRSRAADATIGAALERSTDVIIASDGVRPFTASFPEGVRFQTNALVQKTQGRDATLTVDSKRSVYMDAGSTIRATNGTLNVNFDVDAAGAVLGATVPMTQEGDLSQRIGNIDIENATIATGGGNLRFYGQNDALNGRAIGGFSGSAGGIRDGITINGGTLDTCAGASCDGGGSIALRGQGGTVASGGGNRISSGVGILVQGSSLRTAGGGLSLDGRGGLAANGVTIGPQTRTGVTTNTSLTSAGGDIEITGISRGWGTVGDVAGVYGTADSAGVSLSAASIATGGSVRVTGTGADLSQLQADPTFVRIAGSAGEGAGSSFGASGGVRIAGSNVTAGQGRSISVTGTAGTRAYTVGGAGDGVVPGPNDSLAVQLLATANNGLLADGGQIRIDGGGGDVSLQQFVPAVSSVLSAAPVAIPSVGSTPRTLVSAASSTGQGGSIVVTGRNVALQATNTTAVLDASGVTAGGSVDITANAVGGLDASGIVALGNGTVVAANANSASYGGDGGRVTVKAGNSLLGFGQLQARGSSAGGNGGRIETSGPTFDLRGVQIDASATSGTAGTWLIDPFDVNITHGAAAGSLTGNPFVPLAASSVQDADINAALNSGTSVRITTGTGGQPTDGDILLNTGVNINYTAARGPVTLQLDAQRSIRSTGTGVVVQSSDAGGPLNVVFNADANNSGPTVGGGQVSYDGAIYSNGGNVTLNGNWSAAGNGDTAVHLTGTIDTRIGRSDAGVGGNLAITGLTTTPVANEFSNQPAIWLDGATLATSSGNATLNGSSTNNTGILVAGTSLAQGITSTTGTIVLSGRGTDKPAGGSSALAPSSGVLVTGAGIGSTSGAITLRGSVADTVKAGSTSAGVSLLDGARIATTGGGAIELSGGAGGNGAGVRMVRSTGTAPSPFISGTGNVLLRAGNDGSSDAIAIAGPVTATGVIDLRPGSVDAAGVATDRIGTPITLGDTAGTGFSLSAAELSQLTAATVVVGSNAQAADITVTGAVAVPGALTLQNEGGGNIVINAPVTASRLGLLSAGDITQGQGVTAAPPPVAVAAAAAAVRPVALAAAVSAFAPITADTMMVRSNGGLVDLRNPLNNVGTVGGSAAGNFSYVDANAVTLAPVTVTGFNGTTNVAQTASSGVLSGGAVLVRTLTQDLSINTGINAVRTVDLVAGARVQNLGSFGIAAANWRIWADTWVGETRGGLVGSGALPNLYGCAYLGPCGVTVPATDNHFVYVQRPTATVTVNNASRIVGDPNPAFFYGVTDLILGDNAASFSGTPQTAATTASPAGSYAIGGAFASTAGYAIRVVAGRLDVTGGATTPVTPVTPPVTPVAPPVTPVAPITPRAPASFLATLQIPEATRDPATNFTYTFDRNIAPPPICLATGALDGDRASQSGDVLAREWSRVRSRPNLTSCVSTERRNGCADF